MTETPTRFARICAGAVAGAMALAVMPILGFTGTAGAAIEPTGEGNVCEDAPDTNVFVDVTPADPAFDEINCMTNTDPSITRGTTLTTYSPNADVNRRQMALFLFRLAAVSEANEIDDEVDELPAGDGTVEFSDIESDDIAYDAIDALSDAGIAQGLPDGTFGPNEPVTRRQMAKFLVRFQETLAGEDITPDNPEDAFDDDEGDSGEEELNVLAAEGVYEGDASGNVNPGDDITRRQMAFVLTRKLQYFFENGVIGPLYVDDAPTTNQAYTVTPDDEATNPASESAVSNEGRRTYEVTGLDDEIAAYNVALVPAENVTVDEDGIVSFDDADDDNEADGIGDTDANIETINGVATDQTDAQTAVSTDGAITFTIDSLVNESVVPVIWLDADETSGVPAPDSQLDVDDDGLPTEDFAIGGQKNWVVGADEVIDDEETVTAVDEENDFFETAGGRYVYDADDLFQILDGETCETVSQTVFEQNLSVGDVLLGTDSTYVPADADPQGNSTFCIDDAAPTAVDDLVATTTGVDSVELTWTGVADDTQVFNVYRAEGAEADVDFPDDFTAIGTVDAVEGETDYEFTDDGLDAATTYTYAVTAEADGDESDADVAEATTATDAATIENAELRFDPVVEGAADAGDVAELTFSEETALVEDGPVAVTLQDGNGDVIIVHVFLTEPDAGDFDADDGITFAVAQSFETDETTGEETIFIELLEDAEDRNAAGDGQVTWPLTITAIDNLVDADDGLPIDLVNSPDVLVDDEGNVEDDTTFLDDLLEVVG